ncbi:hypothetical protein J437_LFUL011301 [Ladona fulva]|uniref:Reverse transcriptase domain-containing protein n=1 Tax=Ladona fulva TaxID=123851 RepID=A0A8K0KL18_LADFU|nr:hypothetical protein J437_LFUL011301 [Ladona fulva]
MIQMPSRKVFHNVGHLSDVEDYLLLVSQQRNWSMICIISFSVNSQIRKEIINGFLGYFPVVFILHPISHRVLLQCWLQRGQQGFAVCSQAQIICLIADPSAICINTSWQPGTFPLSIPILRNNILSPSQYGFCSNRSTVHAVSSIVKHILSTFENSNSVSLTLCDIAKTFDFVSHPILI